MRNVTVRVLVADFAREMVAMRNWLDSNGYEPTRFGCNQNGRQITLSVDFTTDAAAEAFREARRRHAVHRSRNARPLD
jgi:hypothetical protein